MYNKKFQQLVNMCMKEYERQKSGSTQNNQKKSGVYPDKPYTAVNMAQPQIMDSVGYIEVSVYTALGALPVENALVTIFVNEDGQERVITYFRTGNDGQTTPLEVPVEYDPAVPDTDPENYYSTYNVRVAADGYQTAKVKNVQVYPKTKTIMAVNLVPIANGEPLDSPGIDVVIPPRGFDESLSGGEAQ